MWLEGLCVWSLLQQMEDNIKRSTLIIVAWELRQGSITLRHHFLSEWQVMCFWDVRENSFPPLQWTCVHHIFSGSIEPVHRMYLLLVRKEMKIHRILVENITSTKGLKEESVFFNFISFTICLDSSSPYELLFETCKRWLDWHKLKTSCMERFFLKAFSNFYFLLLLHICLHKCLCNFTPPSLCNVLCCMWTYQHVLHPDLPLTPRNYIQYILVSGVN